MQSMQNLRQIWKVQSWTEYNQKDGICQKPETAAKREIGAIHKKTGTFLEQ